MWVTHNCCRRNRRNLRNANEFETGDGYYNRVNRVPSDSVELSEADFDCRFASNRGHRQPCGGHLPFENGSGWNHFGQQPSRCPDYFYFWYNYYYCFYWHSMQQRQKAYGPCGCACDCHVVSGPLGILNNFKSSNTSGTCPPFQVPMQHYQQPMDCHFHQQPQQFYPTQPCNGVVANNLGTKAQVAPEAVGYEIGNFHDAINTVPSAGYNSLGTASRMSLDFNARPNGHVTFPGQPQQTQHLQQQPLLLAPQQPNNIPSAVFDNQKGIQANDLGRRVQRRVPEAHVPVNRSVADETEEHLNLFNDKDVDDDQILFLIGYVTKNGCPLSGNCALLKVKYGGFADCDKVISSSCTFTRSSVERVINEELDKIHKDVPYICQYVKAGRFVQGEFVADFVGSSDDDNVPSTLQGEAYGCVKDKGHADAAKYTKYFDPKSRWIAVILFQRGGHGQDKFSGTDVHDQSVPNYKLPIDVFDNMQWINDDLKNFILLEMLLPLNFMVIPHRIPASFLKTPDASGAKKNNASATIHAPLLFEMHRLLNKFKGSSANGNVGFDPVCSIKQVIDDDDDNNGSSSNGTSVPLYVSALMRHWINDTFENLMGPKKVLESRNINKDDAADSQDLYKKDEASRCTSTSSETIDEELDILPRKFLKEHSKETIKMGSKTSKASSLSDLSPESPPLEQEEQEDYDGDEEEEEAGEKLMHPATFDNPSMFLRTYGDPMCDIVRRKQVEMKAGNLGNWACPKCKNLNFPRRNHCNMCLLPRNVASTKIVYEYALKLYYIYKSGCNFTDDEMISLISGDGPLALGSIEGNVTAAIKKLINSKAYKHQTQQKDQAPPLPLPRQKSKPKQPRPHYSFRDVLVARKKR